MFDMGPYYLSALVQLLGPAASVVGMAQTPRRVRRITSAPRFGETIEVEVPTHLHSGIEFHCGAQVSLTTSFDVWGTTMPNIEIWGTDGSLVVPDPNSFGGPVRFLGKRERTWHEMPLTFDYAENCRGLGVVDLAQAAATGDVPRASGALALHVLELMHGIHQAAEQGVKVDLTTSCARPIAIPH